jgi:hypothetical protein
MTASLLAVRDRAGARILLSRPAVVGIALSAVALAGLLAHNTNDGPAWRVSTIVGAAVLVLTALSYGLVIRRVAAGTEGRPAARAALALAILSCLSVAVFWMAIPPVFGVAAVTAAVDARDRRPFRGEATATVALVLGSLGTVVGVVFALI